jgi:hypothetical protein
VQAVHVEEKIDHPEPLQNHPGVEQIHADLEQFQKNGQKTSDLQRFQKPNNVANYSLTTYQLLRLLPRIRINGRTRRFRQECKRVQGEFQVLVPFGSGGNVQINATGIYGIAPLSRLDLVWLRPTDLDPRQLPTHDITAISQTNPTLNGQVNLNTPDVDPSRGLVALPLEVLNATRAY